MGTAATLGARLIEMVRVNRTWRVSRDGRDRWHKRRPGMVPVLIAGNVFLRLSRSGLRMFVDRDEWIRWEVDCFVALHGPERGAGGVDGWEVWSDELPGVTYRELMRRGPLPAGSLEAAAGELHRAHQLTVGGRRFSHGDPHPDNLLYDAASGRAFLFDFDQMHLDGASDVWRHADDILVFLLEVLGRVPDSEWPASGVTFLTAYPDAAVREAVRTRLVPPTGFEAMLWASRTARLPWPRVVARLEMLARVLELSS